MEPLDLVARMASLLDEHGILYALGGSVASSLVGEPRSTVDVDLAIKPTAAQMTPFLESVRPEFYVPASAAADVALAGSGSFNMIHNDTAFKVDLFVLGDSPLDRAQLARRVRYRLELDPPIDVWVTSVEDQILRKLDWFRRGGSMSDRQWRDVLAMIRVNVEVLDVGYLERLAAEVGLADELARAMRESAS